MSKKWNVLSGVAVGSYAANFYLALELGHWWSWVGVGVALVTLVVSRIGAHNAYRRNHRDGRDTRPGQGARSGAHHPGAPKGPRPRLVDEPITAWKLAYISGGGPGPDGKVRFRPLSGGPNYGVEGVALCSNGQEHRCPDPKCSCGFYALDEPPFAQPGQVVLEVELYGRVMIGERGYRAEKQRVLSITATPTCSSTEPLVIMPPSALMAFQTTSTQMVHEQSCGRRAQFEDSHGRLLCADHAVKSHVRFREWAPAPVNCETEWRWA